MLDRLHFILHLEMQAYNMFYQPHLDLHFQFFCVIIPDWQLPKFIENTHKIAQNRVYNVRKLFVGLGVGWRKWGRRENGEGRAPWLLGYRRPWLTNDFCEINCYASVLIKHINEIQLCAPSLAWTCLPCLTRSCQRWRTQLYFVNALY